MSTTRGIFENFPNQPGTRPDSPFAVAPESAASAAASPFTAVTRQDSPFTVVSEVTTSSPVELGKAVKTLERRKSDSPFQVAEPSEGFGYEAPAKVYSAAPFESAPVSSVVAASPFSGNSQQPVTSPFSAEPLRGPSPSTQAALAAFGNWQEPAVSATPQAFAEPSPASSQPVSSVSASTPETVIQVPAVASPAAQSQSVPASSFEATQSDSYSIRQLELRAIFGVDREMNVEEILQRTRALPGVRHMARVSSQEMNALEALKQLVPNLGFGNGVLKLYCGSAPIEFIREGSVMLAVQTDGGFAPGVRETLMLVARELGRLS